MQTVWMVLLRSADSVRDARTIVKWLLTSTRREAWRASRRSRDDRDRSGAVFGVDAEEVMDMPASADVPTTRSSATTGSAACGSTSRPCRNAAASSSA